MKHEGKRKAEKDLPKLNAKKGEWYNNKFCKHKQNYDENKKKGAKKCVDSP